MGKDYSMEQKATLYVSIVTSFVTTFTGSALNLSIPSMGSEFHVSASFMGWVVTAYMLSAAALSVPFGRISDLTDRKKVLVTGIIVFAISSLFSAFAMNIWIMIALRVMQGIGGAMIFSTLTATLISAFPLDQRGKVLGFSIAATYIGLSAGPVVGGVLNYYLGWRSIFIFTFILSGVVSYIAIIRLPKDSTSNKGEFDITGNILYIMTIVFVMYGLSTLSNGVYSKLITFVGIILAIAFVFHEKKAKAPILDVRIFIGNISYTASNIAALMNYGATFAIGYLSSVYLQLVMGYTSQIAGLVLIIQPIIMAIVSPYMGKLSDKVSPHKLATIGMAICTAGLIFFVYIKEDTGILYIIIALVISGIGFGVFSSPNTNAVMACVERKDYGVASSVLATMRSLGHTSSMAIVTLISGIYLAETPFSTASPELIVETIQVAFKVFVVICLFGTFTKPILFGGKAIIRYGRNMLQK